MRRWLNDVIEACQELCGRHIYVVENGVERPLTSEEYDACVANCLDTDFDEAGFILHSIQETRKAILGGGG